MCLPMALVCGSRLGTCRGATTNSPATCTAPRVRRLFLLPHIRRDACASSGGQNLRREDLLWAFPQPEPDPYQLEWDDLVEAIRNDLPYNELERGVQASLVTAMGRMAAHTGQVVKYEDILNSDHEFAPEVDRLTFESPAPLQAGPDGSYPQPMPGEKGMQEY